LDETKTYLFPGRSITGGRTCDLREDGVACLRQAAERAGIQKKISPHCLRHSYATHQLEAGVDLPTLAEPDGTCRYPRPAIYLHVSKRHLQAAPSPLEALQISDPGQTKRSRSVDPEMKPPRLEVADIIRAQGSNFLEHSPGWFTWQH